MVWNLEIYDVLQGKFIDWNELNEVVKDKEYFGDSRIRFEDIAIGSERSLYFLDRYGHWTYEPEGRFDLVDMDAIDIQSFNVQYKEYDLSKMYYIYGEIDYETKKEVIIAYVDMMVDRFEDPKNQEMMKKNPSYFGSFTHNGTAYLIGDPLLIYDLIEKRWEVRREEGLHEQ